MNRRHVHLILIAWWGLFTVGIPCAQTFPNKPIRITLGFPPGGATDNLSRDFAAKLGDELKQQVIIANKPGAGGTIGADLVAKAPADSYILTIGTGARRSGLISDLPSVAESGYPGFESTNWFCFYAPAGTPKEVIAKLYAAGVKVLARPELQERFADHGAEVVANKPEEAAAMLKADIAKWAEVAKKSGAKID